MKVGDLVEYPSFPQMGIVTKVEGHRVWFVSFTGYKTWTHIVNLKVVSESR